MKSKKIIVSFILLIFVFSSMVTASVAWFSNFLVAEPDHETGFEGSSMIAYFAGGDGSINDPYIIENYNHLYNLAWLQNEGHFAGEKYYFKVQDSETKGPIEIDMAGKMADDEGRAGAIPPIGTSENPFTGYFDGCGSVIKNLWVSTKKDDWHEQPEGSVDYSDAYVGLFGTISNEAMVEDFILDRVEVKTHYASTVGIVVGYVDAMVKNVGVYNGIINVGASGTTSKYSLIGDKSDNIIWADMPEINTSIPGVGDNAGGDLVIDPKGTNFTSISQGTEPIPGAIKNTAYYSGSLTMTPANYAGGHKAIWDMRNYKPNTSNPNKEGTGKVAFTSDGSRTQNKIAEMFSSYSSGDETISMGIPFDTDGNISSGTEMVAVRGYDQELEIPKGCVWFKPDGDGTIAMAFAGTDMSASRYAMLYVCVRDEDMKLKAVQTYEYILDKPAMKNGQVVYYEYTIPETDKGKYEYVIGNSNLRSTDNTFGFFALVLAGTDITGGDNPSDVFEDGVYYSVMYDLDYVTRTTDIDMSTDDYVNHQTLLSITSSTVTGESKIYYLAAGADGSSKVYYFAPSGVTMQDISKTNQSAPVDNKTDKFEGETQFKERDEKGIQPAAP